MSTLIDTHCHLASEALQDQNQNIETILQLANENNVKQMINVGITLADFQTALDLAKRYTALSLSVGLHPLEEEEVDFSAEKLIELCEDPHVVAIGETGLDYFYDQTRKMIQKERLIAHIQAALVTQKPLIIHSREAANDIIDILKSEGGGKLTGVFHCFTESLRLAKAVLDLGFYIGVTGIVTFKKATNVHALAKYVPQDRLLIETDSPYLAPVPHRGKTNQPAFVKYVAEKIAELRAVSYDAIAQCTTENAKQLFKLKDV